MESRKIGQWVFADPACPKGATAAVVNRNGSWFYWCGDKPERIEPNKSEGYWNGPGVSYGRWKQAQGHLSAEDWVHSLTIKAESKNKPSDKVIMMPA